MKTVEIMRRTNAIVEGHIGMTVNPGEIHRVSDDQAAALIAAGDALEVKAHVSPAAAVRTAEVVETKEEKPKRGKR